MTEQCSAYTCPVEATISLIGGKYKAVILWHPMNGTLRYSELHRKMPKATDKMLAQQLRELNYSLQKGTEILETLLHFPEI